MTVIVHIMGGLGNQLFQYAAGRSISLLHGQELVLERGWYDQDFARTGLTAREFMLGNYNASGTERAISLSKLRLWRKASVLSPLSTTLTTQTCSPADFYKQRPRRRTLLDGYWTKPEYFLPYSEILREDLTLSQPLTQEAKNFSTNLEDQPCIGIHVRLGDKAQGNNPARYSTSNEYLRRAVSAIRTEKGLEKAFLFSDDPEYCSSFLAEALKAEVVHGSWNEAVDLHLFSKCRHHVISDSTYSWWGAWLGSHDDQMVVVPKIWGAKDPPIVSPSLDWHYL